MIFRPTRLRSIVLAMLLWLALPTAAQSNDGFVPLFNGNDTTGWHNPYDFGEVWVEDGEIRLRADKKFFLLTDKSYGDFIFEGEVLMPEGKSNSGFMFRCHEAKNRVFGYQAEVDTSDRKWAGGLYDEGRRGWLNSLADQPEKQAAFKNGTWNRYRIECRGDRIRIFVNDVLTSDYIDPVDQFGPIGLQHHGEAGQIYRFRNLRIKDLGKHAWKPLWDGQTLTGWTVMPGGAWEVADGAIHGTSKKEDPRHGMLLSEQRLGDFTVRLKFKALAGNSGLYFRADKVTGPVTVNGFQAEIDAANDIGGLYETGGRGWVSKPSSEQVAKYFKPGQWNEMVVSAHGRRIVVHINGVKTAELPDDASRTEGHLGLQLHGGMDMDVWFKDIEILMPENQG